MRIKLGLFLLSALLQWSIPLAMIGRYESTLRHGRPFRFEIAPVDPYDAFRGRYIWLAFSENTLPLKKDLEIKRRQQIFIVLEEDEKGFAKLVDYDVKPPEGKDYLKVRVRYIYGNKVHLRFPFDHFYVSEKAAPAAEMAYRRYSRRQTQEAYVVVRIRSGEAVLEELYIKGKPLAEFLRSIEK